MMTLHVNDVTHKRENYTNPRDVTRHASSDPRPEEPRQAPMEFRMRNSKH